MALPHEQGVGSAVAPTRVLLGEAAQPGPQLVVGSGRAGVWRWVERCWPTIWQARRCDRPRRDCSISTARRRLDGLTSVPLQPPAGRRSQAPCGHDALQPRVFTLQLAEALNVIGLHPAELVAPPVIGLLGNLQLASHLGHISTLTQSRSASRSLRTICSGVCLRRFTL